MSMPRFPNHGHMYGFYTRSFVSFVHCFWPVRFWLMAVRSFAPPPSAFTPHPPPSIECDEMCLVTQPDLVELWAVYVNATEQHSCFVESTSKTT